MSFYRIHPAYLPEEVGIYPQVVEAIYPTTWDSKNALGSLFFTRSNNQTEIPIGILHRKAKLTDFLSNSFVYSPLISQRLKEIFDRFSVYGIEFLETSISDKNILKKGFYFLNIYKNGFKALNLNTSRFIKVTDAISLVPLMEIRFTYSEEIDEAFRKHDIDVLNENYISRPLFMKDIEIRDDCDLDFFALRGALYGGSYFIVSERLKSVMEEEGITGILFRQLNEPFP